MKKEVMGKISQKGILNNLQAKYLTSVRETIHNNPNFDILLKHKKIIPKESFKIANQITVKFLQRHNLFFSLRCAQLEFPDYFSESEQQELDNPEDKKGVIYKIMKEIQENNLNPSNSSSINNSNGNEVIANNNSMPYKQDNELEGSFSNQEIFNSSSSIKHKSTNKGKHSQQKNNIKSHYSNELPMRHRQFFNKNWSSNSSKDNSSVEDEFSESSFDDLDLSSIQRKESDRYKNEIVNNDDIFAAEEIDFIDGDSEESEQEMKLVVSGEQFEQTKENNLSKTETEKDQIKNEKFFDSETHQTEISQNVNTEQIDKPKEEQNLVKEKTNKIDSPKNEYNDQTNKLEIKADKTEVLPEKNKLSIQKDENVIIDLDDSSSEIVLPKLSSELSSLNVDLNSFENCKHNQKSNSSIVLDLDFDPTKQSSKDDFVEMSYEEEFKEFEESQSKNQLIDSSIDFTQEEIEAIEKEENTKKKNEKNLDDLSIEFLSEGPKEEKKVKKNEKSSEYSIDFTDDPLSQGEENKKNSKDDDEEWLIY